MCDVDNKVRFQWKRELLKPTVLYGFIRKENDLVIDINCFSISL